MALYGWVLTSNYKMPNICEKLVSSRHKFKYNINSAKGLFRKFDNKAERTKCTRRWNKGGVGGRQGG